MVSRRVADERHGASRRSVAPREGLPTRLSETLAKPLSVLIVVPSLVVLVGLVLTLMADHALRSSNLEVAHARLEDRAQTVARIVRLALAQADPMLERLAGLAQGHDPKRALAPLAHGMGDLMQGRPGVTYVSVSFPDGTFQGTYLDSDGALRFQDSRLTSAGTEVSRYDLGEGRSLRFRGRERSDYDPRERGFYTLALRTGKAVWTDPYPFFDSHQTGVTRTRPVYVDTDGVRRLHAVVTVDYDIHALSSLLAARHLPAMRAVLYTGDGTVLAYAGRELTSALPKSGADRNVRFSDLDDPVMGAFFAQEKATKTDSAPSRVVAAGQPYLSVRAAASADPTLDWSVAYLAPESVFLRELYRHQQRSLWVSFFVLVVALAVAYAFARHITRTRREMEAAKAEAKRARAEVRELGSYRLVECLGRGGMGEVWRAEHRLLARAAAVKLISTNAKGDSDELKTRFRREAEALASLRSRNTIELFDYGVADDGTFFFVMELLDGTDLETLVNQCGPQPWDRVVPLLIQVCSSLAEAHDHGFIHRDIKPANIFVCRAADELELVKVLDFGLVRSLEVSDDALAAEGAVAHAGGAHGEQGLTLSGGAMGTPGYMPPEQIFGRALSGRADLYALGCVAFWLLTGKLVFERPDAISLLLATVHDEPVELRARVPSDVPDALLDIITACLTRSPEARPASARVVADALRKLAGGSGSWSEADKVAWWAARASPFRTRASTPKKLMLARTILEPSDPAESGVLHGAP